MNQARQDFNYILYEHFNCGIYELKTINNIIDELEKYVEVKK